MFDISIVYDFLAGFLGLPGGSGGASGVYGSEFVKGDDARSVANTPTHKTFTNKPIILKDFYEISGIGVLQQGKN